MRIVCGTLGRSFPRSGGICEYWWLLATLLKWMLISALQVLTPRRRRGYQRPSIQSIVRARLRGTSNASLPPAITRPIKSRTIAFTTTGRDGAMIAGVSSCAALQKLHQASGPMPARLLLGLLAVCQTQASSDSHCRPRRHFSTADMQQICKAGAGSAALIGHRYVPGSRCTYTPAYTQIRSRANGRVLAGT